MPVIGTNPTALSAAFNLNQISASNSKTIQRLSSGSKLADPSDDAAGVGVSSRFEASSKRLEGIVTGVQTLISIAQTADGFLKTIQDQLVRMSELASRAMNGAFSSSDRANYAFEFDKLTTSITNQITNASFNGTAIFDTSAPSAAGVTISAAVSSDGANTYTLTLRNLTESQNVNGSGSLVGLTNLDISTISGASAAIGTLTTLISNVASDRSNINSDVAALNFYVQNIGTEKVNTLASNSRIKDLEFADESTVLAKTNILTQAATAMLAQANTTQPTVLGLLR